MKFSVPILAFVVALLLVASQGIYTVDQRKYAIKFQLGEVIETQANAGLYFKMPLVQNVDRKSTRLNSSHSQISYAVFCLKKKKIKYRCTTNTLAVMYEM